MRYITCLGMHGRAHSLQFPCCVEASTSDSLVQHRAHCHRQVSLVLATRASPLSDQSLRSTPIAAACTSTHTKCATSIITHSPQRQVPAYSNQFRHQHWSEAVVEAVPQHAHNGRVLLASSLDRELEVSGHLRTECHHVAAGSIVSSHQLAMLAQ